MSEENLEVWMTSGGLNHIPQQDVPVDEPHFWTSSFYSLDRKHLPWEDWIHFAVTEASLRCKYIHHTMYIHFEIFIAAKKIDIFPQNMNNVLEEAQFRIPLQHLAVIRLLSKLCFLQTLLCCFQILSDS